MNVEKVIIIGAGPAGIAAGIQLKRYGINPVIFEKNKAGGLLRNANLVENYPGFPRGITGLNLAALFNKQLSEASIKPLFEKAAKLTYEDGLFAIETPERLLYSQIVLIGSGTKHREFSDIDIPENAKKKIFYEIVPILKESGKVIIIVGAGDAAFDYALTLGKNNEVIILNRGAEEKCLPLLKERALKSSAINYYNNTSICRINDRGSGGLLVEYTSPEGVSSHPADYLVFAVGRVPNLDFLTEKLSRNLRKLEKDGFLYFAGDVKNGIFRQTAIAVGDGINAAMKIYGKLKEDTK